MCLHVALQCCCLPCAFEGDGQTEETTGHFGLTEVSKFGLEVAQVIDKLLLRDFEAVVIEHQSWMVLVTCMHYELVMNELLTISTTDSANETAVKCDFSLCFSQSFDESGDSTAMVQIKCAMAVIDQQVVVTALDFG